MGLVKVNPNLEEDLKDEPETGNALHDAAVKALPFVEQATPVGETGRAHKSLSVGQHEGEVVLQASDPFWHLIEFGSVNNPAYAPLRRGIRAAGLRVEPTNPE